MRKWIDNDWQNSVGDVGFLINISNHLTGMECYDLRDQPALTNVSREPRLHGWCGSYNEVSTFACGMAKVIKEASNGRIKVETVVGQELADALERLGFPELIADDD